MSRGAGLVVLAAWLAAGCSGSTREDEPRAPAAPAPLFSLPDLDGNRVELASLRGQVVVVDFWATWCAPCVFQIPVLNAFHERHASEEVVVLGVSVDLEGDGVVREFAEEHGILYPVLLGDEALAREFGALGFPSLFVIAPDGSIDSSHVGVIDAEELERAVMAARERGRDAAWSDSRREPQAPKARAATASPKGSPGA